MTASSILGRPLWYELMTSDLAAAETFYKTVVGWTTAPFEGSPAPYTMWMRGSVPIGGAMTLPAEMQAHGVPPHWMMYVGAPALDEVVAHVERLGGAAVSPVIDVPNVGHMRAMRDPQGAVFSLYQPASSPHPEAEPQPGDVSWHELMTTDAEGAKGFYQSLFGWNETSAMDMGEMGKYHMFGRGPAPMGGMMNKPAAMAAVPPNWLYYFLVADVNAAVERVTANGGKILNGPMEVPGGDWIVQAMDPQGAAFALHQRKA
jgi:predicted enzyme related to lactoylglutathione lyase